MPFDLGGYTIDDTEYRLGFTRHARGINKVVEKIHEFGPDLREHDNPLMLLDKLCIHSTLSKSTAYLDELCNTHKHLQPNLIRSVFDKLSTDINTYEPEHIVILHASHGFGHAVTIPFILDAIFPHKRCLVIICSTSQRHNASLPSLLCNTRLSYVDVGIPGWHPGCSTYVIIPSLIIAYLCQAHPRIKVELAETTYNRLLSTSFYEKIFQGRPTALTETALFMKHAANPNSPLSPVEIPIKLYLPQFVGSKSIFLYVREKGNDHRCCPSSEILAGLIHFFRDQGLDVYVGGNILNYSIPIAAMGAIPICSFNDHRLLSATLPMLCKYNVSLGIGGGTHLPLALSKPFLCITNAVGYHLSFSLCLPGKISTLTRSSGNQLHDYNEITSRLSPDDLAKSTFTKLFSPPTLQESIGAASQYLNSYNNLSRKGYLYGRTFNMLGNIAATSENLLADSYFH